jgi:hypothetical protein
MHDLSVHVSAFWERPVDGGQEVCIGQVKVARGRRDVGVTHQSLDDVDVLAAAHEARGVAVTPTVGVAPTTPAEVAASATWYCFAG